MLLSCPKCRSGYEVDSESIPKEGTYAHCTSCENIFFVKHKTTSGTSEDKPPSDKPEPSQTLGEEGSFPDSHDTSEGETIAKSLESDSDDGDDSDINDISTKAFFSEDIEDDKEDFSRTQSLSAQAAEEALGETEKYILGERGGIEPDESLQDDTGQEEAEVEYLENDVLLEADDDDILISDGGDDGLEVDSSLDFGEGVDVVDENAGDDDSIKLLDSQIGEIVPEEVWTKDSAKAEPDDDVILENSDDKIVETILQADSDQPEPAQTGSEVSSSSESSSMKPEAIRDPSDIDTLFLDVQDAFDDADEENPAALIENMDDVDETPQESVVEEETVLAIAQTVDESGTKQAEDEAVSTGDGSPAVETAGNNTDSEVDIEDIGAVAADISGEIEVEDGSEELDTNELESIFESVNNAEPEPVPDELIDEMLSEDKQGGGLLDEILDEGSAAEEGKTFEVPEPIDDEVDSKLFGIKGNEGTSVLPEDAIDSVLQHAGDGKSEDIESVFEPGSDEDEDITSFLDETMSGEDDDANLLDSDMEAIFSEGELEAAVQKDGVEKPQAPEKPKPNLQDGIDALFESSVSGQETDAEKEETVGDLEAIVDAGSEKAVDAQSEIDALFESSAKEAEKLPQDDLEAFIDSESSLSESSVADEILGGNSAKEEPAKEASGQDDIDAIFSANAPEAEAKADDGGSASGQDDIDAIFSANAPATEAKADDGGSASGQDDIDAILSANAPATEAKADDGGSASGQDDIDAIFSANAPEAEAKADNSGSASGQDDIDAILSANAPEAEAKADDSGSASGQDDIDAILSANAPEAEAKADGSGSASGQDDIDAILSANAPEAKAKADDSGSASGQDDIDAILSANAPEAKAKADEPQEEAPAGDGLVSQGDLDALFASDDPAEESSLAEDTAGADGADLTESVGIDTGDELEDLLSETVDVGADAGLPDDEAGVSVSQDDLDALFESEGGGDAGSSQSEDDDLFSEDAQGDGDIESLIGSEADTADEGSGEDESIGIDTSMLESLDDELGDEKEAESSDDVMSEEEAAALVDQGEDGDGEAKKISFGTLFSGSRKKKAVMAGVALLLVALGVTFFYYKDTFLPSDSEDIVAQTGEIVGTIIEQPAVMDEPLDEAGEAVAEKPAEFAESVEDDFAVVDDDFVAVDDDVKAEAKVAPQKEAGRTAQKNEQAKETAFAQTGKADDETVDFAEGKDVKFGIIVPVDYNAQAVRVMTADVMITFKSSQERVSAEKKRFLYEMAIEDEIEKFFLEKFYEDTHYVQDKIIADLNSKFKKRRDMGKIAEIDIQNFKLR